MKIIKIYSHVRSGTHLLGELVAKNFYKGVNLEIKPITWGHWSNRIVNKNGERLGKLYGSHKFPEYLMEKISEHPSIYIYRDGRAVAYSTWKTENFKNISLKGISFSEYLRNPIDWYGSPAVKSTTDFTIAEHWMKHVSSWLSLSNNNLHFVRYEDLVRKPEEVLIKIYTKFDFLTTPEVIETIDKPIGLLPNKASIDSWKSVFDKSDLTYFDSIVPSDFIGLDNAIH